MAFKNCLPYSLLIELLSPILVSHCLCSSQQAASWPPFVRLWWFRLKNPHPVIPPSSCIGMNSDWIVKCSSLRGWSSTEKSSTGKCSWPQACRCSTRVWTVLSDTISLLSCPVFSQKLNFMTPMGSNSGYMIPWFLWHLSLAYDNFANINPSIPILCTESIPLVSKICYLAACFGWLCLSRI